LLCGLMIDSSDKKQVDIGVKLSQAYLDEGRHEEALSLCERLMDSCDDDAQLLSLSRLIASAAAASSLICTSERRVLVRFFYHNNHTVHNTVCFKDHFAGKIGLAR